jgi:hypothetical protein
MVRIESFGQRQAQVWIKLASTKGSVQVLMVPKSTLNCKIYDILNIRQPRMGVKGQEQRNI